MLAPSYGNPIELLPPPEAGFNTMDKIKTPRNHSREAFKRQVGTAKLLIYSFNILASVRLISTPERGCSLKIN